MPDKLMPGDPGFQWTWSVCTGCGATVRCPKCGMNMCSQGYGEVDGKECDVCPAAAAEYHAARAENRVPRLPGDTVEERLEVIRQNRERLIAQGVRFASIEDLLEGFDREDEQKQNPEQT